MSKLGGWRKPNWYYDEAFQIPRCGGPWDKRKIMALLRRNWKARWRVKNARRIAWHNKRRLPTKSPVPVLTDTKSGPLIRWRNNPSTQAAGGDHR